MINYTLIFVFLSPSSLSSSLCSPAVCLFPSQLVHPQWSGSKSNKTVAICFGTSPRLQSLFNLTFIEVAGTSVSLVDDVKLLGVTFDKYLNFDLEAHFQRLLFILLSFRALRHIRPFLDSETSKTITCAIDGSR